MLYDKISDVILFLTKTLTTTVPNKNKKDIDVMYENALLFNQRTTVVFVAYKRIKKNVQRQILFIYLASLYSLAKKKWYKNDDLKTQ